MITRKLWSQSIILFLGMLILASGIWLMLFGRPLLNALLISALLAYVLNPIVRLVERHFRLQRPLAAALVYTGTLLAVSGLIVGLTATVWGQAARLERELQAALTTIENWMTQPATVLGMQIDLRLLLVEFEEAARNAMTRVPLGSGTILASVTSNLLWSLALLVSFYYLLKDGTRIKPWLVSLLPQRHQLEADLLLNEIDYVWGAFLRMQLLIFAILSLLAATSSLLIIMLFRLGWLSLSPLGVAVLLVAVYSAIQQVDNLWLRPKLMGRALSLHPGVVIVSTIAAVALSGVLAAIMIVPSIATLRIVGGYVHDKLLGRSWQPEVKGNRQIVASVAAEVKAASSS